MPKIVSVCGYRILCEDAEQFEEVMEFGKRVRRAREVMSKGDHWMYVCASVERMLCEFEMEGRLV